MSLRVQTTSLGKINNIIQQPKIIARILKVWNSGNADGSMYSVDFILVDEEGTAIEGTIETDQADEIKSQMVEGSVCEFTNFQVNKPTRIGYKSVKHEFILNFTPQTTINRLAETNAIPTFYFNFEDLENIGSSITQLNTIVDIVGKISTFKSLQMIPVSGKKVPLREIEIENERGTIVKVILWAGHNNRFNQEDIFQRSTIQPIIIAFSSLELVNFCARKRKSSGITLKTYSATRIFVDEEIPQIAELKKKFRATPLFVSPKRESRRQNTNNEELPTVTVKELLRNYVAHKTRKKAKCTGTIVDVIEAYGWYEKGCPTHNTKVRKAPYGYKCEHCNTNIEETKPCDDINERVDVIFFEEQGKLVTGLSASQVYLQHQLEYQLDHKSKFPNELYNLIGREFNFTLRFKANSANFGRPTFYVDEVISNTWNRNQSWKISCRRHESHRQN